MRRGEENRRTGEAVKHSINREKIKKWWATGKKMGRRHEAK